MGGGFDPLHNGHMAIIDHVANHPHVDRVCLIPTGLPVYKPKTYFSASVRLSMLDAVTHAWPHVDVLAYEVERVGVSYTVDTLAYLMKQYTPSALTLVVGVDQWYQFHRWRRYQHILQHHDVWVVSRDGMDVPTLKAKLPQELQPYVHRFQFQDLVPPNVSSTQLRMMLQQGKPIDAWVPPAVADIVHDARWL